MSYLVHDIPKTNRKVFDDADTMTQNNKNLLRLFNNPQDHHSAIHVAGTSGKGTVCYLIDAILRAHTKKTGMSQSPHVYDIRERIQINGQLVSEKNFLHTLNSVLQTLYEADMNATYFETLVIMGFILFQQSRLDYSIIETGLGGRLDLTNTISRKDKLCVITQIGLDHTHILGDTLEAIASEKAGIIQDGNHVIALRQDEGVNKVIEERATEKNASLTWVEPSEDYQVTNDRIATSVGSFLAERDGWDFDQEITNAVLQQVFIPGRFEKRHFKDHLTILDGAHNPQKLTAMARRIKHEQKYPATIVLSLGTHKDLEECLKILKPIARRIIATEYFSHQQDMAIQPLATKTITTACAKLGISSLAEPNPRTALQRAAQYAEPIVVAGSFYLLGEVDGVF